MDNKLLDCFKEENKKCLCLFFCLLTLFLAIFSVSTAVDVYTKVKAVRVHTNPITVSATGEIYAKPDLALTNFSVVNEAKTVDEAMAENTEKMNDVINAVKGQGVEDKDLKTVSFNIYPRYEWYEISQIYPQGKRVLVGYEVRQSLQVKIRNMEKIGSIIQAATDAGANEVGDLQLTIDKEDELKKEARGQAIEKAKTKAKELSGQLGVKIGKIVNFSEDTVLAYYGLSKMEAVPLGMGGGEVSQIATGENKIEVRVSITYEIE